MSARTVRPRTKVNSGAVARVIAVAALVVAVVVLARIIVGGSHAYVVYAQFRDAGGLRQGFKVRIDGAPVGEVESLKLGPHDYAVAKLGIDKSAAPVGQGARATVRAADLLGEKYVDLDPGDRTAPLTSGAVIPPARTGLAVELDDVLNALDVQTRDNLHAFINEQGSAFVGRGGDLAATLAALPPSLDQTRQFLTQFGSDNAALGRLVDESDRVVAAVAAQRQNFGHLVSSASGTLATLGARQQQLGQTVAKAPAALVSLRRTLSALQGAAIPLGPAARGLEATAPKLTATLLQLPKFYSAAKPALDTIRQVSPSLQRLGTKGSPVVAKLAPLATELASFATSFDPVTKTLDSGAADALGVLEGWARSTQSRDNASHIFRFGLTVSPETFTDLAPLLKTPALNSKHASTPKHIVSLPKLLPSKQGGSSSTSTPKIVQNVQHTTTETLQNVQSLLNYLLK